MYRLRRNNQQWRQYADMLLNENRWRAMRYGMDEGLLDLARGQLVPYAELLEEILELIHEDAVVVVVAGAAEVAAKEDDPLDAHPQGHVDGGEERVGALRRPAEISDVEVFEHVRRDAAPLLDEAQEHVLGADVLVVEPLGLLVGQLHHFAGPVGETLVHGGGPFAETSVLIRPRAIPAADNRNP
jgi:hypothetical protein